MRKEDIVLTTLVLTLVICIIGLISNNVQYGITGAATTQTAVSQVVISKYFSIAGSTNLSTGIDFGTITTLPSNNVNATGNYNASNDVTEFYISVHDDSNTNVDFCIKADALNTSAGVEIGLGNETWRSSNTTDAATPAGPTDSVPFNTTYVNCTTDVMANYSVYYRFWLDVPAATAAGTYNNTVTFKGINTGDNCN